MSDPLTDMSISSKRACDGTESSTANANEMDAQRRIRLCQTFLPCARIQLATASTGGHHAEP